MREPYMMTAEDVLKSHSTSPGHGLSSAEAKQRLIKHGPNELVEKGGKKAWRILLDQVREVMILILLAAVVVSVALHEYMDAIVILVIGCVVTAWNAKFPQRTWCPEIFC